MHVLDVITYSSVITRETVCIALTMAALHDLEINGADFLNAYVTAPNRKKIWRVLGQEFADDVGKSAIIHRMLIGLKSAGASFSAHLAQCMQELRYESCKIISDLWWALEIRTQETFEYYSYIWHAIWPHRPVEHHSPSLQA